MIKLIFRNVIFRNISSITDSKICAYGPINRKKSSPNPTFSNSKQIHILSKRNGKLYVHIENSHAYDVLSKYIPTSDINITDKQVNTLEEFNELLNVNYRLSTASEILSAFKAAKHYSCDNGIDVSDIRFDQLVNGLMDRCEDLEDNEILELLVCLGGYPKCKSFKSHNFHDIWSCLDDLCCSKLTSWDIKTSFKAADAWYQLDLGRISDFVYEILNRNAKRANKFSKEDLLHFFFYANISRSFKITFEYEEALVKYVDELSADELSIVAMGFFKTQCKIKIMRVLEAMIQRVTEESKTINEISLTAILKIIRFSQPSLLVPGMNLMMDKLVNEIDRLSIVCCIHVALLGTTLMYFHPNSLSKASQKVMDNISDVSIVRIKDIERLLLANSMFDFDSYIKPDLFNTAYQEIHKPERKNELAIHPRCLACCLNYFSLRSIYSYELMDKLLNLDFINEVYGKTPKMFPREILHLDCSIDIECPDYTGNRLPSKIRQKMSNWNREYVPTYDQYKKITTSEKLFLKVVDHVKLAIKEEKYIHIDHILPHFPRADIILCKDTNQFVEPPSFENYNLGDIKYPIKRANLKWYSIIVLGWNNTIRDTSLPLGASITKHRHLRKIGYKPVYVVWNQFMSLSEEQKTFYIQKLLE